ncbi:MAG: hypothetical protein U0694_20895 [Anaerolineae bacterium]
MTPAAHLRRLVRLEMQAQPYLILRLVNHARDVLAAIFVQQQRLGA